ncbi:hypothetical protein GCM10009114_05150 [Aliiglaciecola litoralis]|uniref:Levanase n=2 Tax=Aliiglaciecola litoralis TaxID=582857 RepID=A0ABN1LD17_9ALTE
MHWGHATSQDLLHWQQHDIALYAEPDGLGYIYSGGAVIDKNNTSGFKENENAPIVATFTHHSDKTGQSQSIAVSIDNGNSFQPFEGNPVIPNPQLADFRDPKVIWHKESSSWVMSLAVGDCIHFYSSADLKQWHFLSVFGKQQGAHDGVWECPDLFPLECSKTGVRKWILLVSINPGGPNGGSAMQYFVGEFDGHHFTSDDELIRWLDYGTDCYAGITWDGLQDLDDQRIMVAWMSNWQYANQTPTATWRGAMTLPRQLTLTNVNNQYQISQLPAANLNLLATEQITHTSTLDKVQNLTISDCCEIDLSFDEISSQSKIKIALKTNSNESLNLLLDLPKQLTQLDRGNCKWSTDGFHAVMNGDLHLLESDRIEIKIILDVSSIEVFINQGLTTFTALYFSEMPISNLEVSGSNVQQVKLRTQVSFLN